MPFVRGREPTSSAMFTPSKASLGIVVQIQPCQQRKGAVDQLHRDAVERAHRGRDLQQSQIDGLVGAEQLPGGDAKHEAVADLTGRAGDCDSYWDSCSLIHLLGQVVIDRGEKLLRRLPLLLGPDE